MKARVRNLKLSITLIFAALGLAAVCLAPASRLQGTNSSAQEALKSTKSPTDVTKSTTPETRDELAPDSAAAYDPNWERPYDQYQPLGKVLKPYPRLGPGELLRDENGKPTLELYRYGGPGYSSYASIDDVGDFADFYARLSGQKPLLMAAVRDYMKYRYDFSGRVDPTATMSRSKPLPVGPVVRLTPPNVKDMAKDMTAADQAKCKEIKITSWEDFDHYTPETIRRCGLFPEGFRPLAHPLQSNGHMLFPEPWLRAHPEDTRFDVDFDIPDAYLPEFPPPLFLTTRPDLGDVSQGREITEANYRELFSGIVTPEQLEGLRNLVKKTPSSWFNQTKHRLTKDMGRGISCFDCHVNGHTNGAIAMDPGTRPTLARVRLDTPSLRGNSINRLFSLRRSIRSLDHFSEVEEYFDGDIALQLQIGGRQLDRATTNRMGDFNNIIAFPPAPKLNRLGRLDPTKATESELRGEKLFFGKASCSECHTAPFYTDNSMHDLKVEEFYPGRAEGQVKTFSLRGIKDSPPYFHDGRLPTLEDSVEFFNLLLQTKLTADEKHDLVAFMRCL
jgi:cytochrome c peroxidase